MTTLIGGSSSGPLATISLAFLKLPLAFVNNFETGLTPHLCHVVYTGIVILSF